MLRGALAAMLLCVAAIGSAAAQTLPPQPAGLAWPTREWQTAPLPSDVDRAAYDLAVTQAFAGPHPQFGETRAVIVVQSGRIVFERYGEGYGPDMRLPSWGVADSITQALVGAAVLQGRVAIDVPMGNAHWRAGDRRASITWRQWLNMVDGQAASDADAMLFGAGRRDTARYAANVPLVRDPGAAWRYNAAAPALIGEALTSAVVVDPRGPVDRRARMRAWMQSALFARIGMGPVVEFDPSGLYYSSALIWATPRDFARFGYLYLRDGVWDGARVLPEGWVDFARTPGPDPRYGAHWWLNGATFSARGESGQLIIVVPGKDLVLVRLGRFNGGAEAWAALDDWAARMIGAFGGRSAGETP